MALDADTVLRQIPFGKVLVIRLAAAERHMDIASPRTVRKRINWMTALERPTAIVKIAYRKLPIVQTSFTPTIPATVSETRRRQPSESTQTDACRTRKASEKQISSAVRHRALVRMPEPIVLRKLVPRKLMPARATIVVLSSSSTID